MLIKYMHKVKVKSYGEFEFDSKIWVFEGGGGGYLACLVPPLKHIVYKDIFTFKYRYSSCSMYSV